MKVVCHQLLHMLGAAQLEGRQGIRDSAISKTYPQVMERITSWYSDLLTLLARISYRHTARIGAGSFLSAAAGT